MNGGDKKLPIRIDIPVAWAEQDAFGHLNNVVFFRYCESVRMHFLEKVGILAMHEKEGIGVILVHAECRFRKPVHWPQLITVRSGCDPIGNTSFTMNYVLSDEKGDIVAQGTSVQVMFDYGRAIKVTVPERIRTAIARVMVD